MIVNIELENKEDFAFIKQLLEKIKGVKSVSVENDYQQNDTLPQHVLEAIEKYGESIEPEDMISKEEFFANARKKVCESYSRK